MVLSMLFISLVVGNPYYQQGIHIGKSWGNLFTYRFIIPLCLPQVLESESFSLSLPYSSCSLFLPSGCTALWSSCTAGSCRSPALLEWLYRCLQTVVPPPCSANAGAVVPSMHRSSTARASGLMRFLGGSGPVGPVVPR